MFIEKKNLLALREHVENKFGRKIKTATDCALFAAEIEKQGTSVNPQTFRRFFGLIKYEGGFSDFTLNALSVYCGFSNYSDFKQQQLQNQTGAFFAETGLENDNYWQMSELLCRKIASSPSLLISTHLQLMHYPLARKFFIEEHPMRDMSATVYSQYFHEYLKFNNGNEAKIFAYGFLFMGAFLSENQEFMKVYHDKIAQTQLTPEVFVVPAGRKFGVRMLYAWLENDEETFQKVFNETLEARIYYKTASESSICSFEYVILEHLLFTDKVDEMRFLIENNTEQKHADRSILPEDRLQSHREVWKIMCSIAYFKMNDLAKSRYYFENSDISLLSFGWQKYYGILYHFLAYEFAELPETRNKIIKILQNLISETHFTYYESRLEELKLSALKIS